MKMQITLLCFLALQGLGVLAAVDQGVSSLKLRNPRLSVLTVDSNVEPPPGTKTVEHDKEKNGGYQKGSPLYNKQEGIAEVKEKAKNPTAVHGAVADQQKIVAQDFTIDFRDVYKKKFYEFLTGMSVYAILVLACAYVYKKKREPSLGKRSTIDSRMKLPVWTTCGFAYSLFDCGNFESDWPICLTAYCCPIIQWADTASRSVKPFMSYWKAIAFVLTMVVLAPFTAGLTALILLVVMLVRRRDLRNVYGHKSTPTRNNLEDICLVFCCNSFMCCQLVQEAREVEYTTQRV